MVNKEEYISFVIETGETFNKQTLLYRIKLKMQTGKDFRLLEHYARINIKKDRTTPIYAELACYMNIFLWNRVKKTNFPHCFHYFDPYRVMSRQGWYFSPSYSLEEIKSYILQSCRELENKIVEALNEK